MSWVQILRQKMSQWSLLARLLCFVSILFIFIWSIMAGHAYHNASKETRTFFDMQVILLAKNIADIDFNEASYEMNDFYEKWSDRGKKIVEYIETDTYSFAVFSKNGIRIFDENDGHDFIFEQAEGFVHTELDDEDWRIFWYNNSKNHTRIAVGYERDLRSEVRFEIFMSDMLPWFIFLVLFLVGFGFLVRGELKPLYCVAQKLQCRKPQDSRPLEVDGLTAEVRPLVESLNSLFDKTANLLERERSFVANAAHELRTPLSGLRLQVEVLERKIDDTAARQNALRKILDGSSRCTRLVDQLLLLSSLESKTDITQKIKKEMVSWNALLQSAEEDVLDAAIAKEILLECKATNSSISSYGSSEFWSIVLRNMLDNAVRYSPKRGIVRVLLQEDRLSVENSANHLSAEVLRHLGERFYRPAGQQERGSGLGLAIMRHIAELHNAAIHMENIEILSHENVKIPGIRVSVKFK